MALSIMTGYLAAYCTNGVALSPINTPVIAADLVSLSLNLNLKGFHTRTMKVSFLINNMPTLSLDLLPRLQW